MPALGVQEVFAFGEGVPLPTRLRFLDLAAHELPRSEAVHRGGLQGGAIDREYLSTVIDRWRGTLGGPRPRVDDGLSAYAAEARLVEEKLVFEPAPAKSGNPKVLTTASEPFQASGGLKLLSGNLGRAVIKVSAVSPEHRVVEAPARVFHSQQGLQAAFKAGELNRDFIAVVRFAGPKAIGMPELHNLTPALGVLQGRGLIETIPVKQFVAAISVGVYRGVPVLDLDYLEDSDCDTDMNVVMTDAGHFVEVQGTAEGAAFDRSTA